ncbi:hypothetical protein [Microseira sp. BLCC-F43]|jgi:aspartate ammonia-lyase|uniref:hypothetical protein n=1 Tax=Microseira sp. BLCC-F43 TaxID=3153602 RepID=UPI0035BB610C
MPSFYPGQKANELAKEAQERYERAVEQLKREEAATNKLAEEYGQLQLNVIRGTIKRFVDFLERTGRKASESEKRLLEGMDFSVQQIQEYKAAAIGAEKYFVTTPTANRKRCSGGFLNSRIRVPASRAVY